MKLTDYTYPEIKEQIEKYFKYQNDFEITLIITNINPDFDKNTIDVSIEYPNNEISVYTLLFTNKNIVIQDIILGVKNNLDIHKLSNVVNDTINDLSKEIYGKTKGKSMYFSETKMKRK
jgi:hypothetical protein